MEFANSEDYINTLGTYTGNMAVQQAKAGLKGNLCFRLASGCRC